MNLSSYTLFSDNLYFQIISLCFITQSLLGQDQLYRKNQFDVLHYRYELHLSDSSDTIVGEATITLKVLQNLNTIELDLIALSSEGTGMVVDQVTTFDNTNTFQQEQDKLKINNSFEKSEEYTLQIEYHGVPRDGLIIGQNKYGHRTFFGDNWPNRARHWLPSVDHPSDKATVEFIVHAPEHYDVVATGSLYEESHMGDNQKVTHYRCPNPLPTKVMVIGVAEFAVQYSGSVYNHPVSSWVYPEDRDTGFDEYFPGVEILKYFVDKIAPYPNTKLAHVQSKTRYGGMENAGNIFYYEGSIDGRVDDHNLIAHEIAHQWFGNSASELDWHHVWLSEGFATYFTNMYIEDTGGLDSLQHYMNLQRDQVIQFYTRRPGAIIDTTITNFNRVLSTNTYQKAGWFLHMLRRKLGDEVFMQGIKDYYNQYKYANALTRDFRKVMEHVSGERLQSFFYQWLYIPGHPQLTIAFTQNKRNTEVEIIQNQPFNYSFPLEIAFIDGRGNAQIETIDVSEKITKSKLKTKGVATQFDIDPNVNLLFELIE